MSSKNNNKKSNILADIVTANDETVRAIRNDILASELTCSVTENSILSASALATGCSSMQALRGSSATQITVPAVCSRS